MASEEATTDGFHHSCTTVRSRSLWRVPPLIRFRSSAACHSVLSLGRCYFSSSSTIDLPDGLN
ncbi:hypothetical protein DPMN_069047 [Dreissena polymorpha]|uniref:Uncharacterized protein n=1 Tax=Dreissena polymorpha TaxID=45954 RepID=A0A9D3YYB0_DREPO|nr:hypothetical protein DPMN_069047 [Dreissena polymorpha]